MPKIRFLGHQGYTMVEMSITLVVAGLLTAIGVVTLGPALEHAKVRSAANVVAGDLQYAQVIAVRERRPVSVLVEPDSMRIVIRDRDQTSNIYRVRFLGAGTAFSLDHLATTSTSFEMFPNGLAGSTINVTLWLRGFLRQVKLTRAGQIRIIRTPPS